MLVHEYEDELFKIADTLNKIFKEIDLIKEVIKQLKIDMYF